MAAFDWSTLRNPAPTMLVPARGLIHLAVQWPARAARANLTPAPDDSHTSLAWDEREGALVSQSIGDGVQVGVRLATLELFVRTRARTESLRLSVAEAQASVWLDARLSGAGLKPASGVSLPYDLPPTDFSLATAEAPRLAALAGWYAAAAELLEAQRQKWQRIRPGTSPVRCWPHHLDIAVLVSLEEGHAESARSIGIGVSPGDEYYAEPYAYVSPYPRPDISDLPPLPPGGRWHTRDFFGAVATATGVLATADPRAALTAIIDAAFDFGLRRLHVQ